MPPQAIIKTPRLRIDHENADYCYSEVFLGTSWRQLSDLPQSDEDCIGRFAAPQSFPELFSMAGFTVFSVVPGTTVLLTTTRW